MTPTEHVSSVLATSLLLAVDCSLCAPFAAMGHGVHNKCAARSTQRAWPPAHASRAIDRLSGMTIPCVHATQQRV